MKLAQRAFINRNTGVLYCHIHYTIHHQNICCLILFIQRGCQKVPADVLTECGLRIEDSRFSRFDNDRYARFGL